MKTNKMIAISVAMVTIFLAIIFGVIYISTPADSSLMALAIVFLIIGIAVVVYVFMSGKGGEKDVLTTDLEIYIAQLEIKPASNRDIKKIASYIETIIMPNEKIIAVAHASSTLVSVFAIVTDKRVILKSGTTEWVTITPIEKVTNITQNGSMAFVNETWINLKSVQLATKFVNIVNNQASSFQTVNQAIKIENKIVTEETITSQLQKLSDLHQANVLTDYEYSIKKQELLDKMK